MRSRVNAALFALALVAGTPAMAAPAADIAHGAYDASGLASWYGDELKGNRTASGEKFDPDAITVAHRSLPLGSFVEITCPDTGKTILARVNDRGPGRRDRLIDMSRGAARLLGTHGRSVASVRVRSITPSLADVTALRAGRAAGTQPVIAIASNSPIVARAPLPKLIGKGRYILQIASFSNAERARVLADTLGAVAVRRGDLWRVRIGPLSGMDDVQRARDAVFQRGYGDAQILPED